MKVELCFYASLASLLPEYAVNNACFVELAENTTVRDVLRQFAVPEDIPKLVFLNGIHAREDEVLKPGDRVAVFPPVAGG
ncbi:MoaD/ThiS family protein [Desulfomonile tiedjei]|uniref:Sulfur transfer protein involved in thiamine biosynthesis n=1 Tax=Desulfomonile tiedjei (strain ATCC 49306 / DSM 6799 / DCB-1) TaxID=706587 RepID=I4CC29_DESTA|nr:MoaD/ThiS family protein [Desulfomonile tiedjei]AFM27120.1 sulfur transfer protein involved in thiamine biosynthesis [Desulfomonile tiedjei DSM 6799]